MSIKQIFLDILSSYQSERNKDGKTSNPFFKNLKQKILNEFKPFAEKYNCEIKPLGGQAAMPLSPYISFLAPGHKTSKGIYSIYHFNLNDGEFTLSIGDADENEPGEVLVQKFVDRTRESLPNFKNHNSDGYPQKIYNINNLNESELASDIETILSVYNTCIEEFRDDIENYLSSEKSEIDIAVDEIDHNFTHDDINYLLDKFLDWYDKSSHKEKEKIEEYINFSRDYFSQLPDPDFIDVLFRFAREGGNIQSGGERTAGKFKQMMESNLADFRQHVLNTYEHEFNISEWWQKSDEYINFGRGIRSILLHRTFPDKYTVYNKKSLKAFKLIGLFPKRLSKGAFDYQVLIDSAKSLIEFRPSVLNFFRADAFTHFLVGTKEGKKALDSIIESARYWKIAPGEKAFLWDECVQKKIISVGWNELGDLKQFETKEQLLEAIKEKEVVKKVQQSRKADELWDFINIKQGDYVLANDGLSGLQGFGRIIGDYKYDPSLEYHNSFPVDWYDVKYRKVSLPSTWAFTTVHELKKEEFRNYESGEIIKETRAPQSQSLLPQNLILYGPPGTGKTYQTVNYSVSIIEGLSPEEINKAYPYREKLKRRYNFYRDSGQIEFITFHQSFSYEDFIEGIKPDLESKKSDIKYVIKDGIFKQICINAYYEIYIENKKGESLGLQKYDFDNLYLDFSSNLKKKLQEGKTSPSLKSKTNTDVILIDVNNRGNLELTTSSGARNYIVSKRRLRTLYEHFASIDEIKNLDSDIRDAIGGCNTTFYWTIFNELKKFELDGDYKRELSELELNEDITYETKKEIIEEFDYSMIPNNVISRSSRFVLIIDEINRGNIANIFGELITLIEKDKRGTNSESLDTLLPYSKSSFSVPPNLFIVGTMNTADRSVEALDTALRRRFSFTNLAPESDLISPQRLIYELWKKHDDSEWDEDPFKSKSKRLYDFLGASPELLKTQKSIYNAIPDDWDDRNVDIYFRSIIFNGIQPDKLLQIINYRIEKLLDNDHCIGHSYFMSLIDCEDPEVEIKDIFQNKIIPLLQEYFYGDLGKIGLILGKDFVQLSSRLEEFEIEFADFEHENREELYEKLVYDIIPVNSLTIDSFKKIYSGIINE